VSFDKRKPKDGTLDGIAQADAVRELVTRAIEEKAWREATSMLAESYAEDRPERKQIRAYVQHEFDKAGAGFAGRWEA
jgi:hypothetical protein